MTPAQHWQRYRFLMGRHDDILDLALQSETAAEVGMRFGCNDPDAAERFGEQLEDEAIARARNIYNTDIKFKSFLDGVTA